METSGQGRRLRRLAAILSADAVGYSRRMAEDETATVAAMRANRETLAAAVRDHGGEVVNAVGDNLLAEFASAVDAVTCALAAQRAIAERQADVPADRRLHLRVGVHLGDLVVADGEIFGDGINVAARLEALAEPGGLCASAVVVDQVRGKVDAVLDDIGPQVLKNIPSPVHAFRLRPLADGEDAGPAVPGFAGRPAIAVLPFEQRGDGSVPDFVADGIAEELIARLSAFRHFPVISRSSTFTYKGRSVDARQVSRELGARYVVEGVVQSADGRVRVTVRLVDGVLGHQVTSERHEREVGDVFALQDEVAQAIVGAIEPALGDAERTRARDKPAPQLDAWESFQRGAWLLFGLRSKEEMLEAISFFRRAASLDPGFASAPALEAVARTVMVTYHWADDVEEMVRATMEAAERAVTLDRGDPWAHAALGYASGLAGDRARSIAAFETAIAINPSLAMACHGLSGLLAPDDPDAAACVMERAIRLSPRDGQMHMFLHQLAVAHFMAGRYEEALRCDRDSLRLRIDQPHVWRLIAASCGWLGRHDEALEALARMRELAPQFTLEQFRRSNSQALVERVLEGWRRAGWTQ